MSMPASRPAAGQTARARAARSGGEPDVEAAERDTDGPRHQLGGETSGIGVGLVGLSFGIDVRVRSASSERPRRRSRR